MSNPTSLTILPNLGDYFREPVSQALRDQEVPASPATEGYIVQLLADFANPSADTRSALHEPVTFLLRDAMEAKGADRFRRLQTLGDGVLYGIGFFGDGVDAADRRYFLHVGQSAYKHASDMLCSGHAVGDGENVLGELAKRFDRYANVLRDVADWLMAMSVSGQEGLLKLYERWQKTGSTVLRDALTRNGLLALPAIEGVN